MGSQAADRGPQVRDVAIAFLIVPWIVVTARCWVRIKMIRAFALDDWLAVATLLLMTVYATLIIVGVQWGVGQHVTQLTVEQRINSMKM